jgi:hypothetical protein
MAKKKHEHGPLYSHALHELEIAGFSEPKGQNDQSIYSTVLRLVDTLERGAKSEYQRNVAQRFFSELAQGMPVSEITDNPYEWELLPGHDMYVNKRCNLFRSSDEGTTWIRTDTMTSGVSKKVKHLIEETSNADQKEESIQSSTSQPAA